MGAEVNQAPHAGGVALNQRRRAVFLLLSPDDEKLLRLGLWTLTAASVGEAVDVLLAAPALAAWVCGPVGASTLDADVSAQDGKVPSPRAALRQAKELGPVRIVTCDTEIRLAGLSEGVVRPLVDEIVSLPAFWRETEGARFVTL
jgi:peroxiredoxin family protein